MSKMRGGSIRSPRRSGAVGAMLVAALLVAVPFATELGAVSCPGSGAKIEVCVDNQTEDTPQILLTGSSIANQITCTGPAPILGAYSHLVTLPANQETCFAGGEDQPPPLPLTGGLVTGMYVHRIFYPPPSGPNPKATQAQQGPVVFNPGVGGAPPKWARINWVYHKTVLTVRSSADSGCTDNGCTTTSCTFRQAIEKAAQAGTARPVLIRFELPNPTTINMTSTGTGCGILGLTRASTTTTNVTIDGTNHDGLPWIVGDRSAEQAGMQDDFPVTIDLGNRTRFNITKSGNTIQGLDIRNTVAPGGVQANEMVQFQNAPSSAVNVLRALRLNGGNELDCSGGGAACSGTADLVSLNNSGTVQVRNVEGRSALDKGVKAFNAQATAQIHDSWIHHNYRGNVQASGGGYVSVQNSTIELGGRRLIDNKSVSSEANGIVANAGTVFSYRNVVERNRGHGLSVRAGGPSGTFERDITCGNLQSGVAVEEHATFVTLHARGIGATFNAEPGVNVAAVIGNVNPFISPTPTAHGLVNNQQVGSGGCDFKNSSGTAVTVNGSQWTGGAPRTCGSGQVTVGSVQNAVTAGIPDTLTAEPTNLLLRGQTVRIHGGGFNAVAGNARVEGCAIGDNPSPDACCAKSPPLSNVCDAGEPPDGGGQCVQVLDRLNNWHPMIVSAVSPSLIVSSIPTIGTSGDLLPCLGDDSSIVVSKKGLGGFVDQGFANFCTNMSPVEY